MKSLLAIALLLASQAAWSCSQRTLGPEAGQGFIHIEVKFTSASGGPDNPIGITALATNNGSRTVYRAMPCMTPDGLSETILGPDGREVLLISPTDPVRGCPDGCCAPFARGESEEDEFQFDGKLYTDQGKAYDAPAGEYTVVASFSSTDRANGGAFTVIERRATFQWAGR